MTSLLFKKLIKVEKNEEDNFEIETEYFVSFNKNDIIQIVKNFKEKEFETYTDIKVIKDTLEGIKDDKVDYFKILDESFESEPLKEGYNYYALINNTKTLYQINESTKETITIYNQELEYSSPQVIEIKYGIERFDEIDDESIFYFTRDFPDETEKTLEVKENMKEEEEENVVIRRLYKDHITKNNIEQLIDNIKRSSFLYIKNTYKYQENVVKKEEEDVEYEKRIRDSISNLKVNTGKNAVDVYTNAISTKDIKHILRPNYNDIKNTRDSTDKKSYLFIKDNKKVSFNEIPPTKTEIMDFKNTFKDDEILCLLNTKYNNLPIDYQKLFNKKLQEIKSNVVINPLLVNESVYNLLDEEAKELLSKNNIYQTTYDVEEQEDSQLSYVWNLYTDLQKLEILKKCEYVRYAKDNEDPLFYYDVRTNDKTNIAIHEYFLLLSKTSQNPFYKEALINQWKDDETSVNTKYIRSTINQDILDDNDVFTNFNEMANENNRIESDIISKVTSELSLKFNEEIDSEIVKKLISTIMIDSSNLIYIENDITLYIQRLYEFENYEKIVENIDNNSDDINNILKEIRKFIIFLNELTEDEYNLGLNMIEIYDDAEINKKKKLDNSDIISEFLDIFISQKTYENKKEEEIDEIRSDYKEKFEYNKTFTLIFKRDIKKLTSRLYGNLKKDIEKRIISNIKESEKNNKINYSYVYENSKIGKRKKQTENIIKKQQLSGSKINDIVIKNQILDKKLTLSKSINTTDNITELTNFNNTTNIKDDIPPIDITNDIAYNLLSNLKKIIFDIKIKYEITDIDNKKHKNLNEKQKDLIKNTRKEFQAKYTESFKINNGHIQMINEYKNASNNYKELFYHIISILFSDYITIRRNQVIFIKEILKRIEKLNEYNISISRQKLNDIEKKRDEDERESQINVSYLEKTERDKGLGKFAHVITQGGAVVMKSDLDENINDENINDDNIDDNDDNDDNETNNIRD